MPRRRCRASPAPSSTRSTSTVRGLGHLPTPGLRAARFRVHAATASRRRCPAANRCCSRCTASRCRAYRALAIDTALEQLDQANRAAALDYLDPRRQQVGEVVLIDNRLPPPLTRLVRPPSCRRSRSDFACDLAQLIADAPPCDGAADRDVRGLDFGYRNGKTDLPRRRRRARRRARPIASPAPTAPARPRCLKLLVGVLVPIGGEIMRSAGPYRPWRDGNRAIALATQNPDHQWCGATLREDLARRRTAFVHGETARRGRGPG